MRFCLTKGAISKVSDFPLPVGEQKNIFSTSISLDTMSLIWTQLCEIHFFKSIQYSIFHFDSRTRVKNNQDKVFLKTKTQPGNSRELISFYDPYLVSRRRPAMNLLVLVR